MDRRKFIQFGAVTAAGVWRKPESLEEFLSGEFLLTPLQKNFLQPAAVYKPGGYWWWFNGLINKEGITRDMEAFKAKGIGEVLLVNSVQGLGGFPMPDGVKFLSPEWRELFRFALATASRVGIKVGVNFSAGWCMGGPWIKPEQAGRWFLQSRLTITGPQKFAGKLPLPGGRDGYDKVFNPPGFKEYIDLPLEKLDYRDTAVVAIPHVEAGSQITGKRKEVLDAKTNRRDASNFILAKDAMGPTLVSWATEPGDQPIQPSAVIDLTARLNKEGILEWDVPEGSWTIIRTGHRMTGSKLMIAPPEASGLSVGWLNSDGVDAQFEHLGKILLEDGRPYIGNTLQFFCDDSFEDGFPNWTARIIDEFKKYRGYDPTPYLPVFSGYLVGSAEIADRFLHDYRKTVADCMANNHYGHFADLCHKNGLQVQNESAGPSRSGTMCMDGLKNLGRSDRPMGEFWIGLRHDQEGGLDEKSGYGIVRLEGGQNKVTKMVASAAHIYGKQSASAEAFTTWRHWEDYPGSLKQASDRAFCEGINRFFIHTLTATRPEDGKPGYEYGAGTHFNPNVTWWNKVGPFLTYISRCQYLLREGKFVADVLYYNGDWAPNIVPPKHIDPSTGKGYDYDVCNEEVLLSRLAVKNGRIVLPDGMSYRILVLPDTRKMPLPVLKKIGDLVKAGATVAGPKPRQDPGLNNFPVCDEQVKQVATEVWGDCDGEKIKHRLYGKGHIYWGVPTRDILLKAGITPDFEYSSTNAFIDFIHRTTTSEEIYFIANRDNKAVQADCTFRVAGKQPELWDPVTGEMKDIASFRQSAGRTTISFSFEPFQSWFIIFKKPVTKKQLTKHKKNFPQLEPVQDISRKWQVKFDEQWGGPASVEFDTLDDWSKRPEDGIKYYSGTAVYSKRFDADKTLMPGGQYFLELGVVKNIAEVKLNGKSLGIVWTHPWRVAITGAFKAKDNLLEIEVVNCWTNRLIGDATLPKEKQFTHTNIVLKKDAPLLSSGLLGPVRIMKAIHAEK
jgi:hypothetical protein